MGFVKATTTPSASLAIFATFLLLLLSTASAGEKKVKAPVNPFCKSAPDKAVCTAMVRGAQQWPEAMTNGLNVAKFLAEAGKIVVYQVGNKLPDKLKPKTKDSIESTCRESYETMMSNLNKCLELVKDDPTSAMKYSLSAVSLFDCTNALDEYGVASPEVAQFDREMTALSDTLLAVLKKKKSSKTKPKTKKNMKKKSE